ncbi:serine/threonine-protein kinase [Lichenicoccus roseus]|uniref:Protein kinase domain-containing protein n=1 Tax=Lichenicoccus roseus TaxID=2683649 RepID=A0A5R9JAN0_9PROT|nr:hypothetical protein [Lichenicoccus roseus]TLU71278.1 hypothetical protein FE263_17405 [Lichenicoccus roseus]
MSGQSARPPQPSAGPVPIIADRYLVLASAPRGEIGGVSACKAEDRRGLSGELLALKVMRDAPCRPRLPVYIDLRHEGLLAPLASGFIGNDYWIIAPAPGGRPMTSLVTPWIGNALLTHFLRPAAAALERLHGVGLTHRAIRPDNVFLSAGGGVVLGPCWAAPAAMHQPPAFEPPESLVCAPNARGQGTAADDVYALGVLLLALWRRRLPMEGLSTQDVLRSKLELGSHAALTENERLPQGVQEILRAMLAEQPAARPTASSLTSLDGIHERRVIRRTMLRSGRPIAVGERPVWNCRSLALACADQPAAGLELLRQGTIEQWIRRYAEDAALASRIAELRSLDAKFERRSPGVDDAMLMRLVAALDPDAPLFWRGWLWPDGLGSLLAAQLAAKPATDRRTAASLVEALIGRETITRWLNLQDSRSHHLAIAIPARLARDAAGLEADAMFLLALYVLNPFLACASPVFAAVPAGTQGDLILSLERGQALPGAPGLTLDADIMAFLSARAEDGGQPVPEKDEPFDPSLRGLMALARCQKQSGCGPAPRLAAALLQSVLPMLQDWPGASRRTAREAQVRAAADGGDLAAMLGLLTDQPQRTQDAAEREEAIELVIRLSQTLNDETVALPERQAVARKAAQDTAAGAGLVCLMGVLLLEMLA